MTNATVTSTKRQRCIEPDCAAEYKLDARLYTCLRCSGLLEIVGQAACDLKPQELRDLWDKRGVSHDPLDQSGVWRYRESLPFTPSAPVVSLAEGNTPLYDAPRSALYCGLHSLRLKHQGCNPTGSFKDTGMTTAVTQACVLGARAVVCASTGNTAASLAAYAARANLQCAIIVPAEGVSSAKLAQSLDYGALVLQIEGNFDDAMRVIRELADEAAIYTVNSINPFRIEGQKTVAWEIVRQLGWRVPDHVVVPGGNLGNSTALGKGFAELLSLGVINRVPKLSVVQAEGAAPFANLFSQAAGGWTTDRHIPHDALSPIRDPQTLATAIKIGAPVSWKKALRVVVQTSGYVLSVSEQEVADAKAIIGRDGIGCEPASATTIAGLKRLVADKKVAPDEEVVAVLTGHVLKDADYVINYHEGKLYTHRYPENAVGDERSPLSSTFSNTPVRVQANKSSVIDEIKRAEDTSTLR